MSRVFAALLFDFLVVSSVVINYNVTCDARKQSSNYSVKSSVSGSSCYQSCGCCSTDRQWEIDADSVVVCCVVGRAGAGYGAEARGVPFACAVGRETTR